jgi:hypothetical protein
MLPPKKGKRAPNSVHGGARPASSLTNVSILLMTVGGAPECHLARPAQFALRRKVPCSDAPIVRLHERGAGVFGQLEEPFRRFQLPLNPAQGINHFCTPGDIQHRAAAKKRLPRHNCPFLLWMWPAGHSFPDSQHGSPSPTRKSLTGLVQGESCLEYSRRETTAFPARASERRLVMLDLGIEMKSSPQEWTGTTTSGAKIAVLAWRSIGIMR